MIQTWEEYLQTLRSPTSCLLTVGGSDPLGELALDFSAAGSDLVCAQLGQEQPPVSRLFVPCDTTSLEVHFTNHVLAKWRIVRLLVVPLE